MAEHEGHHEVEIGSERSFGIVFAIVFSIIGAWPLLSGGELRLWSMAIAAVFLGLGFAAPRVLRPLNTMWFKFGMLLGRIIAPVVISILFFVTVTPTGLIMRLMHKDILRLKLDRNAKSYWISRSETDNPMGSMKKQF